MSNDRQPKKIVKHESEFRVIPVRTLVAILLPTIAIMVLFLASYSSFISMSLHETVPGKAMVSDVWTLDNYRKFFASPVYFTLLFETLYRSAQVTVLSLMFAYPLAYCLARSSSKMLRQAIMLSMIIPLLSGGIAMAYSWMVLLGNVGMVNSILEAMGIIETPIRFLYHWLGIIIALVHFCLPFTALSLIGPIRNVPRTLEEAGLNLGASKARVFFRVVLPLTVPGIIEALSLTYALALSSFLFPMMLGGGRVKMMANVVYEAIYVTYNYPFAGALATILLLVSILTVLAMTCLKRTVRRAYE